jgi:hypothetical protein
MLAPRSSSALSYICSFDPALDRDSPAFDWAEYLETGDPVHAPIRDGDAPTTFELRRLTRKQFLRVIGMPSEEQASEAVAHGLRGVKNYQIGGRDVELRFRRTDLGERMTDECMEQLFSPELFGELGVRILSLSTLGKQLG